MKLNYVLFFLRGPYNTVRSFYRFTRRAETEVLIENPNHSQLHCFLSCMTAITKTEKCTMYRTKLRILHLCNNEV
jgi:hypothetical protein